MTNVLAANQKTRHPKRFNWTVQMVVSELTRTQSSNRATVASAISQKESPEWKTRPLKGVKTAE